SDVGDLCYDIKLVAAKIGIFPLEFKSSAPKQNPVPVLPHDQRVLLAAFRSVSDNANNNYKHYQHYHYPNVYYHQIDYIDNINNNYSNYHINHNFTYHNYAYHNYVYNNNIDDITNDNYDDDTINDNTTTQSTPTTTPTTTTSTTSTTTTSTTPTTTATTSTTTTKPTTSTTTTPPTTTTPTTTTTTTTTPKPTICPLINGLSSNTYIPSYSISGVSSDPIFGYSISRSASGFMDIDLSAVNCRPNPVYIERICLYGNIKQANIRLQRSVTANLVFSELSFTTTGDAMADSLCYSIGFNISAVRIAPQLVKSYDSAATNFPVLRHH
uniref:ZP domain-containing protein n=1 Tax=Macrostomum lignano TaxID=282301 RepID=A0A1I8FZY4_9PLAT